VALFNQDALNPGVKKREVFGWAMYYFANLGYTTVVITAVCAAYFVGGIAKVQTGPQSASASAQADDEGIERQDAASVQRRRNNAAVGVYADVG